MPNPQWCSALTLAVLASACTKPAEQSLGDVIQPKDIPSICASETGLSTAKDHKITGTEMVLLEECAAKYMAIIKARRGR